MIKHLTDEATTVNHNIDPQTDTEGHLAARRPRRTRTLDDARALDAGEDTEGHVAARGPRRARRPRI